MGLHFGIGNAGGTGRRKGAHRGDAVFRYVGPVPYRATRGHECSPSRRAIRRRRWVASSTGLRRPHRRSAAFMSLVHSASWLQSQHWAK